MKDNHYTVTIEEKTIRTFGVEAKNKIEAKNSIEKIIPWHNKIIKIEKE